MTNILQYRKKTIQTQLSYIEDDLEVILIVDCEDTRQLIKTALEYEKPEVNYG